MSTSSDETTIFRTSWSLYDTVTEHNYMSHREIYALVDRVLEEVTRSGPYSILDLGCGNARFLAPCLKAHSPYRYEGVDLSPVALEEARSYLAGIPHVTLKNDDMLRSVVDAASRPGFDIIFTGFAVHHLDASSKQELFRACSQSLTQGGRFLMVDVLRKEGETREQYMERYLNIVGNHWTALALEQREEIRQHVAVYDFPATLAELNHMAGAVGLAPAHPLGSFGDHHVIEFPLGP